MTDRKRTKRATFSFWNMCSIILRQILHNTYSHVPDVVPVVVPVNWWVLTLSLVLLQLSQKSDPMSFNCIILSRCGSQGVNQQRG